MCAHGVVGIIASYVMRCCAVVASLTEWDWLGAMCELANKRYSHDGMSFKGFIAGPSLPYCAHFSGLRSGVDGQEGDRAR